VIQQINGMAAYVAAFRVTGKVTGENYRLVVLPGVKRVKAQYSHFNFMLVFNTGIENYTMGAWIHDWLFSLKNITRFKRMALVADSRFVKILTMLVDKFAPGDFRYFPLAAEQEATEWVNVSST
jgi:hypothetical protein